MNRGWGECFGGFSTSTGTSFWRIELLEIVCVLINQVLISYSLMQSPISKLNVFIMHWLRFGLVLLVSIRKTNRIIGLEVGHTLCLHDAPQR